VASLRLVWRGGQVLHRQAVATARHAVLVLFDRGRWEGDGLFSPGSLHIGPRLGKSESRWDRPGRATHRLGGQRASRAGKKRQLNSKEAPAGGRQRRAAAAGRGWVWRPRCLPHGACQALSPHLRVPQAPPPTGKEPAGQKDKIAPAGLIQVCVGGGSSAAGFAHPRLKSSATLTPPIHT
jgi:hypothetical protein